MTPMMEQWHQAKQQQPDALLLFRMGDFYELFDKDAITAAPILDLALTCRDKDKDGMRMAGFPFHAADGYIEKLVDRGFKVAVCEQLEDPKHKKGIVKRGITNVITPGTALIGEGGAHHEPTYLVALRAVDNSIAIAMLDMQSSSFLVSSSGAREEILSELARIMPREIVLVHDDAVAIELVDSFKAGSIRVEKRSESHVALPHNLHNVALKSAELAATTLILGYVKELKGEIFAHIGLPKRYAISEQLLMDEASRFNLDLSSQKKRRSPQSFLIAQ